MGRANAWLAGAHRDAGAPRGAGLVPPTTGRAGRRLSAATHGLTYETVEEWSCASGSTRHLRWALRKLLGVAHVAEPGWGTTA